MAEGDSGDARARAAAAASRAYAADGVGADFYWRYCVTTDHIAAAVDALMRALKADGRLWNPYNISYTKSMFRRRLQAATRGQLVPIDEVKRAGSSLTKLFEIRWSNLSVQQRLPSGQVGHVCLEARLYYAEPDHLGLRIILGLHCHEKLTTGDDETVRAAQDAEIAKASRCYAEGMTDAWGVEIT